MNLQSKAKITGFGAYLPEKILTNSDLEKMVDTSDEWIVKRTGMRQRHISGPSEYASDLAIGAVQNLIDTKGIDIQDVDMLIVTTFTPDHFTPHTAALVQGHFGIRQCGTFDLGAACTGFTYAMSAANALITCGQCKKVLIVAAEAISKVTDYQDRTSCILFGDAAVACLLEYTDGNGSFLASHFSSNGDLAEMVSSSNLSNTINGIHSAKQRLFNQDGKQVYKYVVQNIPKGVRTLVNSAGLAMDQIDWFIPHSANMRIVESICEKIPFSLEKTLTSMEYYGNTSSASIPLAIWLAERENRIKKGELAVLYGFGGGLTHGGMVIRF